MNKAASDKSTAKKRRTAAQKFRELPAGEKRRRIESFIEQKNAFVKGRPKVDAVGFLIKLRRGE